MRYFIKSLFINFLGSLMSVIIVAISMYLIFRVPDFKMYLRYNDPSTLSVRLDNEKWWLSFGYGDVQYILFIPKEISEYKLIPTNPFTPPFKAVLESEVELNGKKYRSFSSTIPNSIPSDSMVEFFRITGDFDNIKGSICYILNTQYGTYPSSFNWGTKEEELTQKQIDDIPCVDFDNNLYLQDNS